MSLVSKRLLSSQGRTQAQQLWRASFSSGRSHASAGTIISSQQGASSPLMEKFSSVASRSGFAPLRPQGKDIRAFSSVASSRGGGESSVKLAARARVLTSASLLPLMAVYHKLIAAFPLNVALFSHVHHGMGQIMADYVHHEMTRTFVMISLRLFLLIAAKDVFVSLVF